MRRAGGRTSSRLKSSLAILKGRPPERVPKHPAKFCKCQNTRHRKFASAENHAGLADDIALNATLNIQDRFAKSTT